MHLSSAKISPGDLSADNSYAFLSLLAKDYPTFSFRIGPRSHFHYPRTIVVSPDESHFSLVALHELAHALLKHQNFSTDVKRLKMESAAWELAKNLAEKYQVPLDEDFIESELDSYRDWLHSRSKCPICGLTRFETPDQKYHCPLCDNLIK